MTPYPSFTFAAFKVAACRVLSSVTFSMDPALGTGTYYVAILANGLLPTPGTPPVDTADISTPAGLCLFCDLIVHTSGSSEKVSINAADYGYANDAGWTYGNTDSQRKGFMFYISSTAPTSVTSAGAHVWTNATGS